MDAEREMLDGWGNPFEELSAEILRLEAEVTRLTAENTRLRAERELLLAVVEKSGAVIGALHRLHEPASSTGVHGGIGGQMVTAHCGMDCTHPFCLSRMRAYDAAASEHIAAVRAYRAATGEAGQ